MLLLWTNVNKSTFIGYVGQLTFTLLCLYTFVKPISHCGLWSHNIKYSLQRCVHAPVRTRCCKLKGNGSAHTSGCSTAPNQNTYKKWEIFHSEYGWNQWFTFTFCLDNIVSHFLLYFAKNLIHCDRVAAQTPEKVLLPHCYNTFKVMTKAKIPKKPTSKFRLKGKIFRGNKTSHMWWVPIYICILQLFQTECVKNVGWSCFYRSENWNNMLSLQDSTLTNQVKTQSDFGPFKSLCAMLFIM